MITSATAVNENKRITYSTTTHTQRKEKLITNRLKIKFHVYVMIKYTQLANTNRKKNFRIARFMVNKY